MPAALRRGRCAIVTQRHAKPFGTRIVSMNDVTPPSQGVTQSQDQDPAETREWLESIDSVLRAEGPERAHFLIERLIDRARRSGAYLPYRPNTAYVNTVSVGHQPEYPGDRALERRIEAFIRWNAIAMVVQANRKSAEYGGRCTKSGSIISGALQATPIPATWCTCRAIHHPESMRAPTSKAG